MSYRQHPTKGPGWWYITVEKRIIDQKTGKTTRSRDSIKFQGSEVEAAALDADLNNKHHATEYPSVIGILPRFLSAYQNNSQPKTYAALQNSLKHILPYFGEMRLPLIQNHHYEGYKSLRLATTYLPGKPTQKPEHDTIEENARRRHISKNSINRELNALKALLAYAEKDGVLINCRPQLFPAGQINSRVPIPLSPSELWRLLEQLTGPHETIVRLMIWGGLRRTEACGMRCEDIDMANNSMLVKRKGGKTKAMPILGSLQAHLKKIKGQRITGWLSPNPQTGKPYGNIMKTLRSACKKAGIDKHIFHHLLRHSAGTAMMAGGVQQRAIQMLLDHADIKTTGVYTHPSAQFLQDAGSVLDGLIGQTKNAANDDKQDFDGTDY